MRSWKFHVDDDNAAARNVKPIVETRVFLVKENIGILEYRSARSYGRCFYV